MKGETIARVRRQQELALKNGRVTRAWEAVLANEKLWQEYYAAEKKRAVNLKRRWPWTVA
jgi:hypothetical protein